MKSTVLQEGWRLVPVRTLREVEQAQEPRACRIGITSIHHHSTDGTTSMMQ